MIKACPFSHDDTNEITSYQRFRDLLAHILKVHGYDLPPRKKSDRGPSLTEITYDECYGCPSCQQLFGELADLRLHVYSSHLGQVEHDSEDAATLLEVPEEDTDFDPVFSSAPAERPAITEQVIVPEKYRPFNEAVMHAFDEEPPLMSKKTLELIDIVELVPFRLMDEDGNEDNALAGRKTVARLSLKHKNVHPILPAKRRHEETYGMNGSIAKGLETLLLTSPYTNLLRHREFVELPPAICTVINRDWGFFPQTKYVTAKAFAGAILYNTSNGQAAMANTVEVYGRTKNVDVHREPHGKLKTDVMLTSVPPPITKFYQDVWPVTLYAADGPKLLVGTQVSNLLITSLTRLDTKIIPSIGSTSTIFKLPTLMDSHSTKIFLDREQLQAALVMDATPETSRVSDMFIMAQLRQIRSKFHESTAYTLCRESGPITKAHTCQPYTTFTLSDLDRGRNPSADLFRLIGMEVLKRGHEAKLMPSQIKKLAKNATGRQKVLMEEILCLSTASHDSGGIHILQNERLNSKLSPLANLLMPSIVSANETVAKEVASVFAMMDR
ncbi:hypothetical protein DM01DRAFT_323809 [Hesseltinella vesiculosa]|uniref:C2H2-type domain-containing protein n=1 Tax=Hesseltinella vesiculosa TaxID=101127 RepID=A0A1X2G2D1_9FUNG|nr:hypothetical protein DM01DRAFT_323809 [Hesseltinella vesiculosa]